MKQYNPDIYHRHSIRLKGYDYSQEGLYFITICTQNHKHLFGEIKNVPHVGTVGAGSACPESNINIPQMILNPYGEIIQQCYWDLEHKYPNIECCEYVIMPNHFHAIIKIDRGTFRAGEPRNGHTTDYANSLWRFHNTHCILPRSNRYTRNAIHNAWLPIIPEKR